MISGKTIIYLDWNTLSGLRNPNTEPFEELNKLIDTFEDDLIIPYSPSHLADLNKDYENNKIKIDEDLQYLKSKTKDVAIAKYFGQNETVIERRDLVEFFHEIHSDKFGERTASQIIENAPLELGIDLKPLFDGIDLTSILPNKEELEKSESGQRFLKQFPQFTETGDFWSLVKDVANQSDLFNQRPEEYNELRKGLAQDLNLDPNISNWDSALEKLDKYLPDTTIGKSFSEILHENVKRYHKEPIFYDYYVSAYNQLGLFGFRPDKLSKKNRFTNTIEDANHSYYGAVSNCFITNDRVMYYRSKALFEAFEIRSKLFKTFKVDDVANMCEEIELEIKRKAANTV
ncbi:MAG: hypothetical protein GWP19_13385 [Planctomycetia bacterium]|nr:hypothetical protein [Planctomycetia bacterium]